MSDQRVFSEQEVMQIMRRAVELTEAGTASTYTPGITLTELERIAEEVGVAPDALRRAIIEGASPESKKGPLHLTEEFERVVEGEIDPTQFDILLEGIRPFARAGSSGVSQVGRSVSISHWTGVNQAKINVTSRNGRTRLKVKSNSLFPGLMALYPGFVASLLTVASMAERGMGWLGAAIGAGIMLLATGVFRLLTKSGHRRAEQLADSMRERIALAIATQGPVVTTSTAEEQATIEQRLGS